MRFLVTGAGGFVGRHLLGNLTGAGHEVAAVSHKPMEAPEAIATEVFDISNAETLRAVIKEHEPQGVIHLAAQASVPRSWEDPADTYRTNFIGASNLLEALRNYPTTRVLLVGSAQEYGSADLGRPIKETDPLEPSSPYAVSKVAQEFLGMLYHREVGLEVVVARSFNHTGPGQSREYAVGSFCSQIVEIEKGLRPPRMEVGRLDSRRDLLDVRDVVRAYRLLVEKGQPGQVYNVASGEGVRIGDVLEILLDIAGLSESVEVLEKPRARAADMDSLVGDGSKIRSGIGWTPHISLEDSLFDTLDWYRKHLP